VQSSAEERRGRDVAGLRGWLGRRAGGGGEHRRRAAAGLGGGRGAGPGGRTNGALRVVNHVVAW
jgi:hypothetical protein